MRRQLKYELKNGGWKYSKNCQHTLEQAPTKFEPSTNREEEKGASKGHVKIAQAGSEKQRMEKIVCEANNRQEAIAAHPSNSQKILI